jgi:hypothetical protein
VAVHGPVRGLGRGHPELTQLPGELFHAGHEVSMPLPPEAARRARRWSRPTDGGGVLLQPAPGWGWADARTLPTLAAALILLAWFLPFLVVVFVTAARMRRLIARHGFWRCRISRTASRETTAKFPLLVSAAIILGCQLS